MRGKKMEVDDYIKNVIGKGDEGSRLLAKICAPTLKNSGLVEIVEEGMNGLAVLNIPKDHYCVVHSVGGDPEIRDLVFYTGSMVNRLVNSARKQEFTPVGFANVIDASEGKKEDIITIGNVLAERANHHKIPILNGELAILGNRVNCTANISGTMISIVPKSSKSSKFAVPGVFTKDGVTYAVFDPGKDFVWINSDGIGTKTEFYERAGLYELGLYDSLAMKLDDTIKIGATARVVSDVVETKGDVQFDLMNKIASLSNAGNTGFDYILQQEEVGERIRGYNEKAASYNVSGSAVSTINKEKLKNLPKPSEGEVLIAIRGQPNPRSNGISDKRKIMINLYGENWHETEEGKIFLKYLAQPSIVLYPVFKELIDSGAATSVYHMSGGAYNGKLARPLAKHGLFAQISNLFNPDYRELALMGASGATMQTAYAKWPMGNDGFVSTKKPEEAIGIIEKHGLEARVVGGIKRCDRTGVELTALNGEKIYYRGD
jgi:phosphoribosylaminoimidazole (AIR) synthetase